METDKELLKIYMSGFNDELDGRISRNQFNGLKNKAYNLGKIDAIIGDEITSVDYQTNEEILLRIKQC